MTANVDMLLRAHLGPQIHNWSELTPKAKLTMLARLRARAGARERLQFRRIDLYPKQAAIVDDPARFTMCEATTKAGKSASHLEWILEAAIAKGRGEWWWVAPIFPQSKMMFRRAEMRLRGYMQSGEQFNRVGDALPFALNRSELFVEVGGARVWFKGADNPDSLYGEDVQGAVGDEITRWKEESWHALYSTLTATKGRCKLIGNVKGRRNFAYKLARRAEGGEPGWGYHKLTALDAVAGGIMDSEIVEAARRDLPEAVFRELYMAEASDDQGNPFGYEAIRACRMDALSTDAPVVWGWDLAKSTDWTWGVALDERGRQCRSVRFQASWDDTTDRIIRETAGVPAKVDSTGVGDPVLEQLQKRSRGVFEGFKFTAPSKQQIMEGLAVALQSASIGIGDALLVSELESFEYEYTRTGVRYSAPAGLHDDGVCALALAVSHRRHARRRGDYGIAI